MSSKMTKIRRLREAIQTFDKSEQDVDDYVHLFMIVYQSVQPADGLMWRDIQRITNEELFIRGEV